MSVTEFSKLLDITKNPSILNLAAGKERPLDLPYTPYFLLNLDNGYYNGNIVRKDLLTDHINYLKDRIPREYLLRADAFEFMEKYPIKFDRIVIYRFLEHVKRTNVLYFIYLMATSLNKGGIIDCIVPNYIALADRILKEDVFSINFEAEDIITTYELLNEPESPHCSIWTPDRIKKFFELEKRFYVEKIEPRFDFDGRDIYIRALARRL